MRISVVSPIHNEADNIPILHDELVSVLENMKEDYEIIFIDDGSTDDSFEKMKDIASNDKNFKTIKLRRNFGQSSALQAGFDNSKGEIVVSIDADLQNDPRDIPKLINKLNEGYDCVSGWRHKRKDSTGKKFFSKFASLLRRFFIGTDLHDYGCTLKAYKRECLNELELSGEMHRYTPPLLRWRGFKTGEVKIDHRERKFGKTHYGMLRLFKGFMDMINVWFWMKFHGRPLHLFGGLGILSGFIGIISALISIYWKFTGVAFTSTPLPLFSVFMTLTGVLLFVFGLIADISLKNYYSAKERKTYSVEEIID